MYANIKLVIVPFRLSGWELSVEIYSRNCRLISH